MKAVKRICAFLIGLVLFVAGLVKLMDPVGAGLVVEEYFQFLHLGFLMPVAKVVGVGMALLETLLGAALLAGVWPVAVGFVSLAVLAGFTVLTFVFWIVGPSMDCGCFGEAVHLTHFQSLMKNVVLLLLWAVAFIPMKSVRRPKAVKYVSFGIAAVSVVVFALFGLKNIPPIDFTSFKPGVTLQQAESAPGPDSPLLSICDSDGDYFDELLASGPVLVVSAYDYDRLGQEDLSALGDWMSSIDGVPVYLVTGGSEVPVGAYSSDRRTLMTLNRSNGGVTLLSDGLVIAKWSAARRPASDRVSELLALDPTEAMIKQNTPKRLKLQGFLLYVTAVLLLL